MAQIIESEKLLIKDIFNKWYRIPEYQRPFVWGSDQISELLDDIHNACKTNKESEYFLGSMVLKKKEKKEGNSKYFEYDLLDGQQRLTTLFLITAVIRDLSDEETRIKTASEAIFQMANPDDNIPERMRIIFDIRDKVKDFVELHIKTKGGTLKDKELNIILSKKDDEDISIRNMTNAIFVIREYFKDKTTIDEFFPYLRSNVLMIYVSAEELQDAFHLFTVMNNRGIKLRNSDILKAENLSKIKEDKKRITYAKKWESIEDYFGEDFDNFLSQLRTILVKQKAGYNLLKEFEDNIYSPKEFDRNTKTYKNKPPLLKKGEETFTFIDKYFKNYQQIFEIDELESSFEAANLIQLMYEGFEADYWVAPLLKYYDKFKRDNLPNFINKLNNKFSADWITGLSPTIRIENINKIINRIETCKDVEKVINSKTLNLNEEELKRVLKGDIYGKSFDKYILLRLDLEFHGHTTKFIPHKTISVEHILPQNPEENSQWKKDFDENKRLTWTNKLGNLVLISRRKNSSQGRLDYKDKKSKYFKGNVELFSNSIRVYKDFSTWGVDDLKSNHLISLGKFLDGYDIRLSKEEKKELIKN